MAVFLTAVVVLAALVGLSAGLVGLAELAGRVHRRELTRQLIAGVEGMLLVAAPSRGR